MEYEVNVLEYRYIYGNDRLSVNITGVENGAGKVESWTHYNEWGEITHNAVLKCGQRELGMVKRYATHDYDSVLGMYNAIIGSIAENRRFTTIDPILDASKYDI